MDRNVVTTKDALAARQRLRNARRLELKKLGLPIEEAVDLGAGDAAPKADDAATRLAKYIPAEALSLYLTLAGIVATSASPEQDTQYRYWLLGVLVVTGAFNGIYLWRIWHVERWSQITVSCVALLVYSLATGGPLVQSLNWPPVLAPIAVVTVTAFLAFFQPPEKRAVDP